MSLTRHLIAAAMLGILGIGCAHANEFYGGASIGQKFDGRYGDLPSALDTDSTAKFFLGWQFAQDWSIEGAYHNLGDANLVPITDFGFDTETDGWSLGVRYTAPVDWPVKPFAKLGFFSFTEDGRTLTIAGPRNFSSDDDGLMVEVGGDFYINDTFAIRAGYEWFDFDGDSDGAFNVGAEIHF